MSFEQELARILPLDLPHRADVITRCALHLGRIVEANQQFNLTRIIDPHEAAIKHVLDSVLPWRFFQEATHVIDAGTGAGFPGVPLALVLPEVRFTLVDSVGKKAAFVESTIQALQIENAQARNTRAEGLLQTENHWTSDMKRPWITGRAVAPLVKTCALFGPAIRAGSRALLYKGRDAEMEIQAALPEAKKQRLKLEVLDRFTLPGDFGERTMVLICGA